MKKAKRLIAGLLVFCIATVSMGSENMLAANYTCANYVECGKEGDCYEVVCDNAPLRDSPGKQGKVLAYLSRGKLICVTRDVRNRYGNLWKVVTYTDNSGHRGEAYIYSENCLQHKFHAFQPMLRSNIGSLEVCTVCGYATAAVGAEVESCDLRCVANQMVKGDYADEDTTFWGLVARIAVGEIPVIGTASDIRDLVYDCTHNAGVLTIGTDLLALVPLIGALKFLAKTDNIKLVAQHGDEALRYSDEFVETVRWGKWEDYQHVKREVVVGGTKRAEEHAIIGKFYYTEHAVKEFQPSQKGVPKEVFKWVEGKDGVKYVKDYQTRGISPTYINDILENGVANGTAVKIAPGTKGVSNFKKLTETDYTVYASGSLDILVDESTNTVVSVIEKGRNNRDFAEIYRKFK